MKKLLVMAALTVSAAPAMASKARVIALNGPAHAIDAQTVFVNPADLHYLGDYATLELGNNTSTYGVGSVNRGPKAEGGFVRTLSFGKMGAYVGHRSESTTTFVDNINMVGGQETLLTEQNPLDVFYASEVAGMKMGVDFHYSNAQQDSGAAIKKVSTAGALVGVRNDVWNAYFKLGLLGKSEANSAGTPALESKGLYKIGGGCFVESIYYFANYETATGTFTAGGANTDITKDQYEIGMVNNHKVDGGIFFYGASYLSSDLKSSSAVSTTHATGTSIPLVVGLEVDAASWMTLRGSVKQSVLVGDAKTEVTGAATKSTSLANDTTIGAGVGFKWNKVAVDATLAGSANGQFDAGSLLANTSVNYTF